MLFLNRLSVQESQEAEASAKTAKAAIARHPKEQSQGKCEAMVTEVYVKEGVDRLYFFLLTLTQDRTKVSKLPFYQDASWVQVTYADNTFRETGWILGPGTVP